MTNNITIKQLQDPVKLTKELIQCKSITPIEGGALRLIESWMKTLGFECHRLKFSDDNTPDVDNLFAIKKIAQGKNFCFAGHTDVVPTGNKQSWSFDPFTPQEKNGYLYGRGAVDMKGAIAAFISAIARYIENNTLNNSISLLITNDEEDVAINGTRKVLQWLEQENINLDFCLVGEPTSIKSLGDTIKIGRRGSINTKLTITGHQGHVAFPEKCINPVHILINILHTLKQGPAEKESKFFTASNLEITSIDVGNETTNLIPETASAKFNIRFNDNHTCQSLSEWINRICKDHTSNFTTNFEFSGEAEFIKPDNVTNNLSAIINEVTGITPELTTNGATSDARFIRNYCPVLEFGLIGETMHKVDEKVSLQDLEQLTKIYERILTIRL